MNRYLAIILFGTAGLTYMIRVLPFLTSSIQKMPDPMKKVLNMMPVAALGALLLPGTIQALPGMPAVGLLSIGAAALVAWFIRNSLVFPVLVSIGVTWLILIV